MIRKRITTILIAIILVILLGTTNVNATLKLNNLDFDVSINDDGSMDVIETWDIYISETNTLYKTIDIDKSKYDSITNFSVREITSRKNNYFTESYTWKYHLPKDYYFGGINNNGKYEISWGVNLDNSSATRRYEIKYTVLGAVHKYGDCAELYWQFLGDKFEIPAEKITGVIRLPGYIANKEDIKVWGHSEDLNGEIRVADNNTVKFDMIKYKSKHFVEVRIAMPTYIFGNVDYTSYQDRLDDIIEEEAVWAEEANARRERKVNIAKIIIAVEIGILFTIFTVMILKVPKYMQKLKEVKKLNPVRKLEYYRDLPDETATPTEAMFLLTKYVDTSKALSSTLLNLALKKQIEFTQKEKNINVMILNENIEQLEQDEQQVMKLLFKVKEDAKTDVFTMKQLEKYVQKHPTSITTIEKTFTKSAKENAEKKKKFNKEIEKKGINYQVKTFLYIFFMSMLIFTAIVPVIIISEFYVISKVTFAILITLYVTCAITMIINAILTSKLVSRHSGYTQEGLNEKEEWKAFKKYMLDFSLLNEKEVPHLILWERFLVFATAFGIAEKVIKQLKIKYPELSNPDTTSNMIILSTLYHGGNFNTHFISSINSSTANMYSSYSSSTGGGGGFSGGGGGRRPVEVGGGGR
jgi:uncharacterized membrane protein